MSKFKIDGEKNARQMLASAIASMGTMQRKFQALVEWGVSHAETHGDHTFLTDLYRGMYAKNKRTANQMQLYLFDLLNLEKEVLKEGGETVVKFVRAKDDEGKKLPLIRDREVLAYNWWEYKKHVEPTAFDVAKLEEWLTKKAKHNQTTEGAAAYCQQLLEVIAKDRVASLKQVA